jgi:phage N-6-adenine-methyltransferase
MTEVYGNATEFSDHLYIRLAKRVDEGEAGAIRARWDFGHALLAERHANGGKQLPDGRLDEICSLVGKSRTTVSDWVLFAERYEDQEVSDTSDTWREICGKLHSGENDYGERRSQRSAEWYTPAYVIEAARAVLGDIDLDPASCAKANETVQAAEYFTEEDDGLNRPWHGRVWLNPPYQGKAGAFASKLAESYASGDIKAGILLITALTTDTQWFRALWDGVLCFTYGRIKFDGEGGNSNTAGSVFVYFGPDPATFQGEFERFGAVVERRQRLWHAQPRPRRSKSTACGSASSPKSWPIPPSVKATGTWCCNTGAPLAITRTAPSLRSGWKSRWTPGS